MARTEKVYPEWVQKYRTKGTTVKYVRGKYYLYKRTSKRVKGKKYPQSVDTYIGVITPDGIVNSKRRMVTLSEISVYEYGFSKAVWELADENWKKNLGDEWADVLRAIIAKHSQNSYLTLENKIKKESEFKCQFSVQASTLSRKMYKQYGYGLSDLDFLKTIYLVKYDKGYVISKTDEKQKEFFESFNIKMGEI